MGRVSENEFSSLALYLFFYLLLGFVFIFDLFFVIAWYVFYIQLVFPLLTSFPLGNRCLNSEQNTNKHKSNLKRTSNEPGFDVNRS